MIAGGFGGATGDMMMHSLDTVKTRQQGAPSVLKYSTMGDAYTTIFREEGFRRGLYGGVAPAFMGSLPGTMIFFGTYEYSKRHLLDMGCPDAAAYLIGGLVGDLFASVIYVPSEVLKTRLQLQGRYNNPYFKSGYNYRGTIDATRTIIRTEGFPALFYGYKATIMRDLPFSALQFAFYEEFQKWAKSYQNSRDIGICLEILTGGAAGGLAGVITCPLDVVKTRIQTQVRTEPGPTITTSSITPSATAAAPVTNLSINPPHHTTATATALSANTTQQQHRKISTSSPSTTPPPKPGTTVKLNTNSIYKGLGLIYRTEGIQGWFRGVGPRMVWTSVQSGTMLVLYQSILKKFEAWWPREAEGEALN
ncbi:mitochondrial carrier domain-containing protein [Terfezia claveryi]|nr:mitochondrial carrier domain-containing protein [Terfezia claveryi]